MAAFRAAIAVGAGIECDVRLSADGEAMLFHDPDLRRLCDSDDRVESSRVSLLAAQRLQGSFETIPRLTELLDLAKGAVPLLLELKTLGDNADALTAAVASHLDDHPARVGVMSFDAEVGEWLALNRPDIRRGLVLSGREGAIRRWLGIRRARPHFLAVKVSEVDQSWVQRARRRHFVYTWTVRAPSEREAALAQADAPIWEADGRP